jgi:hypothetical protein
MSVFYPIRMATEYFGCRHESGHACYAFDVFGLGSVRSVTREWCQLNRSDYPVEDLLGICAAGIAGCQAFGVQFHQGGNDIRQAEALMRSLPGGGGVTHRKAALERAEKVIRRRLAFVDELGTMLKREVDEVSGDDLDRLWRRFYPNEGPDPTYRQRSSTTQLTTMSRSSRTATLRAWRGRLEDRAPGCSRDVLPYEFNKMVEGSVCIGLRASCRVCARPAKWPN